MPIHVVGLGLDPESQPESHAAIIDQAEVLVGDGRLLALFEDHPATKLETEALGEELFTAMAEHEAKGSEVVLLCQGDPLFHSLGGKCIEAFGPANVRFLPGVTLVQEAAARVKIPWDAVTTVCLDGPDLHPIFAALMHADWVAVLTNETAIPSAIAQALIDKGAHNLALWIFENLGQEEERYEKYSLEQAAGSHFSRLNIVFIERTTKAPGPLSLGLPDDDFAVEGAKVSHWTERAAALAALNLHPASVLWDLGAGAGAVAVEAASLIRRGRVLVVEKNAVRVNAVRENVSRYEALTVEVVHGTMPRVLEDLPDPDRIFIGGGLTGLDEVFEICCERLAPGGRLATRCSSLEHMALAREKLTRWGWDFGIEYLAPCSAVTLGQETRFFPSAPTYLVYASKPED